MAATLGCTSTHMVHNAPSALPRTSRQPATTPPTSVLHFRNHHTTTSLTLSHHHRAIHLPVRASSNSDNVRELASEKAVESGKEVADDTTKLANGKSAAAFDAAVEDSSDAASYNSDVRASVVDVASDMAVDPADVDDQAKKDAEPLAKESGRSIDDTVEALESKAEEVSAREASKET